MSSVQCCIRCPVVSSVPSTETGQLMCSGCGHAEVSDAIKTNRLTDIKAVLPTKTGTKHGSETI